MHALSKLFPQHGIETGSSNTCAVPQLAISSLRRGGKQGERPGASL